MTRKDYEAVADVMKRCSLFPDDEGDMAMHRYIASRLGDRFKQDNPRFDKNRWLEDCGVLKS